MKKFFINKNPLANFLFFALIAVILNLAATHKAGYATPFSTTIYSIGIFLLVLFIIINERGYERIAVFLSAVFFNAFFFTFSYYYGLRSLVFIYYFPFFISFIYMYKSSATKFGAQLFTYTSFAFIAAILLLCNMNGLGALTPTQLTVMYIKNFVIAFLLSAYYFYGIYSYLIKQKEAAEEASKSKARFLSIMSHELRTPLNGIIGTINLMATTSQESERQNFISILKSSSEHLLHLVNNVLDYSKASAGKMELNPIVCSVQKIILSLRSVFQSRFEEKNLVLEVSIDEALKQPVLVDDIRFVQVLTNLLSNALKFTDHGKAVLEARCLSISEESMEVEVSVTDTGKGLSAEQQRIIFESFSNVDNKSRKVESSGLGLSISKMIVELMGSQLFVESKVNKGSKFYFRLQVPFAGKGEAKATIAEPGNTSSLEGLTILIAEDNPINMMVAREFLKKWKVQILEAKNGLLAKQILLEKTGIDLLLLDLQMPEMNGYELMEWIQQTNLSLPVIAFTAEMMANEEKQNLFKQGFTDMVPKPFDPEELQGKMKKALSKKPHIIESLV